MLMSFHKFIKWKQSVTEYIKGIFLRFKNVPWLPTYWFPHFWTHLPQFPYLHLLPLQLNHLSFIFLSLFLPSNIFSMSLVVKMASFWCWAYWSFLRSPQHPYQGVKGWGRGGGDEKRAEQERRIGSFSIEKEDIFTTRDIEKILEGINRERKIKDKWFNCRGKRCR